MSIDTLTDLLISNPADLVYKFHSKYGLPNGMDNGNMLLEDNDLAKFRVTCLHEELQEFEDALKARDEVGMADALCDLIYFAYGTALFMGIPWMKFHGMFCMVQRANMNKVRCETADESKRHSAFDLRKPEGWVGPEESIAKILANVKEARKC
jgi:hypothetical protein